MVTTETSSESWGGRIMNSIKGILFGGVLFLAAFPLLWWNEGRSIKTHKALNEGAAQAFTVSTDQVNSGNEGRLVHATAEATTDETLRDEEFGVATTAIRLNREVEMYQWEETTDTETKKKLGGGTETVTTYDYRKEWSGQVIDSSQFKESEAHQNPGAMAYSAYSAEAAKVSFGAFRLSEEQVGNMNREEPLAVNDALAASLPDPLKAKLKVASPYYYMGENPSSPQIGDHRISFSTVQPAVVSIVARQTGDSFTPWSSSIEGYGVNLFEYGSVPLEQMFEKAQARNRMLTWLLRAGGFFIMALGLYLVFNPLAVVADVVPIFGSILRGGVGIFAGLFAAGLSLITIALGWVAYRPMIGVPLLVGGILAIVLMFRRGRKASA